MQIDGFGTHQLWGFSPSLDLAVEQSANHTSSTTEFFDEPWNILLAGTSDVRHIIATISYAHMHPLRRFNFYILDDTPTCLARHILFLLIFHDSDISIPERAQLFLELYGNALLRSKTRQYLQQKSSEVRSFMSGNLASVSDLLLASMIDMSSIKYKERDELEDILRFWELGKQVDFDMSALRDLRLRNLFKDRYDFRSNLIDWDYHMGINETASILHSVHYQLFRNKGQAFELRECEYAEPNYTLATEIAGRSKSKGGGPVSVRGFWGDIIIGPFIGFCLETIQKNANPTLFEMGNMMHKHSDIDVGEYNLSSLMVAYEHNSSIVTTTPYVQNSNAPLAVIEECDEDVESPVVENNKAAISSLPSASSTLDPTRVVGWKRAVFGVCAATAISNELSAVFSPGCHITIDSAKYIFPLKPDERKAYRENLIKQGTTVGWTPVLSDDQNPSHCSFMFG